MKSIMYKLFIALVKADLKAMWEFQNNGWFVAAEVERMLKLKISRKTLTQYLNRFVKMELIDKRHSSFKVGRSDRWLPSVYGITDFIEHLQGIFKRGAVSPHHYDMPVYFYNVEEEEIRDDDGNPIAIVFKPANHFSKNS